MAFTTKAFDLYYKRIGPTGSLPQYWYTESLTSFIGATASYAISVSSSFLSFPDDYVDGFTTPFLTTRDSQFNATYLALPWGSAAGDFLWNVLTPSWSYYDIAQAPSYPNPELYYNGAARQVWSTKYVSSSFFKNNSFSGSLYGKDSYLVTSSWLAFDPKVFGTGLSQVESAQFSIIQTVPKTLVNVPGYNITWPTVNSTSTSSVDNQYFDQSGGVGISKTNVSQSLVTASAYATDNSATGLRYKTEALKARRLYFPVPYSGSGATGGTDYWFKKNTGKRVDSIFYDNGGIYNVQFSLKRHIPTGYAPDLGSFMTAFIHNVIPQIPSSSNCIGGASGWYPPANNIVTIGNQYNGTSELSFFDIQTGFYVEKFNFNLIQYGYPAQLCLEVSGSLTDNTYFGIIVDEFKMCKIGVTTDPRFIKPTSIATTVIDFGQQLSLGGGDLA